MILPTAAQVEAGQAVASTLFDHVTALALGHSVTGSNRFQHLLDAYTDGRLDSVGVIYVAMQEAKALEWLNKSVDIQSSLCY